MAVLYVKIFFIWYELIPKNWQVVWEKLLDDRQTDVHLKTNAKNKPAISIQKGISKPSKLVNMLHQHYFQWNLLFKKLQN